MGLARYDISFLLLSSLLCLQNLQGLFHLRSVTPWLEVVIETQGLYQAAILEEKQDFCTLVEGAGSGGGPDSTRRAMIINRGDSLRGKCNVIVGNLDAYTFVLLRRTIREGYIKHPRAELCVAAESFGNKRLLNESIEDYIDKFDCERCG